MVNILAKTPPTGRTWTLRSVWDLVELPDGVRQRALEELPQWIEVMRLGQRVEGGVMPPQAFTFLDDGKRDAYIRDGRTGKLLEKIEINMVEAILPRAIKKMEVA
ncbi:MAG: hypothetical protein AB7P02_12890 [Alphaproteobacteria bacterium]